MMRPTNILLTNHYNFMQKEQIIRSVSEAVFFDSQEIRLDRESKNFGENVEKIARYLSANIILSAPGLTVYVGNPRLPRRLVKRFGGKTRHSVSLYWQGTVGIAPLLGFLSRETGVQTLRFNVERQTCRQLFPACKSFSAAAWCWKGTKREKTPISALADRHGG